MARRKGPSEDLRKLHAKVKDALLAGKLPEARKALERIHALDPDDLRVHTRLAEVKAKMGDTKGAVRDYVAVAHRYAEQGFVAQAIAINKAILRLDPTNDEVKKRLAELAKERGDEWALATLSPLDKAPTGAAGAERARQALERAPLLSGLSGKELEEFMDALRLVHVPAQAVIYEEGSPGEDLYLIGMGRVRLELRSRDGKRRVFAHLGEGDFFGERAFMARRPHEDAAVAETDCDLLVIDRETFDAWVSRHPQIADVVEDFYRRRVLARLLALTPVFEGVPPEARLDLARRFQLRSFPAGAEIVREGERGTSFFLIRSGEVEVWTTDLRDRTRQVKLGELGEGDFFGEVALLTDKPRTATVRARTDVEAMELSREDFEAIAGDWPEVRKVVERYLKRRVKDTLRTLTGRA